MEYVQQYGQNVIIVLLMEYVQQYGQNVIIVLLMEWNMYSSMDKTL